MARFARDCIAALSRVVKDLEVSLGPDTGDLAVRVGLHSGPVIAGVLRGDRARFQLFGGTQRTGTTKHFHHKPHHSFLGKIWLYRRNEYCVEDRVAWGSQQNPLQ